MARSVLSSRSASHANGNANARAAAVHRPKMSRLESALIAFSAFYQLPARSVTSDLSSASSDTATNMWPTGNSAVSNMFCECPEGNKWPRPCPPLGWWSSRGQCPLFTGTQKLPKGSDDNRSQGCAAKAVVTFTGSYSSAGAYGFRNHSGGLMIPRVSPRLSASTRSGLESDPGCIERQCTGATWSLARRQTLRRGRGARSEAIAEAAALRRKCECDREATIFKGRFPSGQCAT
jgi:hypothetical protein